MQATYARDGHGASSASDHVALQDRPVKGASSGRVTTAMAHATPDSHIEGAARDVDDLPGLQVSQGSEPPLCHQRRGDEPGYD